MTTLQFLKCKCRCNYQQLCCPYIAHTVLESEGQKCSLLGFTFYFYCQSSEFSYWFSAMPALTPQFLHRPFNSLCSRPESIFEMRWFASLHRLDFLTTTCSLEALRSSRCTCGFQPIKSVQIHDWGQCDGRPPLMMATLREKKSLFWQFLEIYWASEVFSQRLFFSFINVPSQPLKLLHVQ